MRCVCECWAGVQLLTASCPDDTIQYLAPTLEPFKGCTVIDIHPGACVWSSKLHDFLKPKHHLLMEPEERYVEPFIRPLLEKPGSTFKYTPLSGANPRSYYENYEQIFHQGIIPDRPNLPENDPKQRQLDTSMLVTGNLARLYTDQPVKLRIAPFAHQILTQMTWASLSNELFHRGGLVRMLWWLPEQHKGPIMPQNASKSSAFSRSLHLGLDISEVVGTKPHDEVTPDSSSHNLDNIKLFSVMSEGNVRRKMQGAGIRVPAGRSLQRVLDDTSQLPLAPSKSPLEIRYHDLASFEDAANSLEDRLKKTLDAVEESAKRRLTHLVRKVLQPCLDTLEYPQCQEAIKTLPRHTRGFRQNHEPGNPSNLDLRMVVLLDLELRIVNLEAHYKHLEEMGHDVASYKDRLLAMDARLHSGDKGYFFAVELMDLLLLQQIAFYSAPPLIPYERRAYEPLQAESDDFWPRMDLALFDVTPNGRDISAKGLATRPEVVKTAQELIKYLYTYRAHRVGTVLDRIAPNAAQDLLPMAPSIADARRGGRLNVERVKVRMLSETMIQELVQAWFEWPFRPTTGQLAISMEGGGPAADGEEELAEMAQVEE